MKLTESSIRRIARKAILEFLTKKKGLSMASFLSGEPGGEDGGGPDAGDYLGGDDFGGFADFEESEEILEDEDLHDDKKSR